MLMFASELGEENPQPTIVSRTGELGILKILTKRQNRVVQPQIRLVIQLLPYACALFILAHATTAERRSV